MLIKWPDFCCWAINWGALPIGTKEKKIHMLRPVGRRVTTSNVALNHCYIITGTNVYCIKCPEPDTRELVQNMICRHTDLSTMILLKSIMFAFGCVSLLRGVCTSLIGPGGAYRADPSKPIRPVTAASFRTQTRPRKKKTDYSGMDLKGVAHTHAQSGHPPFKWMDVKIVKIVKIDEEYLRVTSDNRDSRKLRAARFQCMRD